MPGLYEDEEKWGRPLGVDKMKCPRCSAETEQLQDKRYSCTDEECTLFSFRKDRMGKIYDIRESGVAWIHTRGNLDQMNPNFKT